MQTLCEDGSKFESVAVPVLKLRSASRRPRQPKLAGQLEDRIHQRSRAPIIRARIISAVSFLFLMALGLGYFGQTYGTAARPIETAVLDGRELFEDPAGRIRRAETLRLAQIRNQKRAEAERRVRIIEQRLKAAIGRDGSELRVAALAPPSLALTRAADVTRPNRGNQPVVRTTAIETSALRRSPEAERDLARREAQVREEQARLKRAQELATQRDAQRAAERAERLKIEKKREAALARKEQEVAQRASALARGGTITQSDCRERLNVLAARAKIWFEVGADRVTSRSRTRIQNLASAMSACPRVIVEVAGHTDRFGGDAFNFRLSWRRAEAVAALLRTDGVPTNRLIIVGYGPQRPLSGNASADAPAGRAANRRVEFVVR